MIEQNVQEVLAELAAGNPYGEEVVLVAATKTQSAEDINLAIRAGVRDIGENKVQEFVEKFDAVQGANRHFIGHLQTNKVKYLVGKTYLFHSVDRMELAEEIAKRSQKANVVSDILLQVNIGNEETKGGFSYAEIWERYQALKSVPSLRILGFMAMLPVSEDEAYLVSLVQKMRSLYEKAKLSDPNIRYLSMGMSGDYRLCVAHGSNMVRIGTGIFGARDYTKK